MLQPRESSPIHVCILRISVSHVRLEVNFEDTSKCRVHTPACSIGFYSYTVKHELPRRTLPSSHDKYLLFNNRYGDSCHIAQCKYVHLLHGMLRPSSTSPLHKKQATSRQATIVRFSQSQNQRVNMATMYSQ